MPLPGRQWEQLEVGKNEVECLQGQKNELRSDLDVQKRRLRGAKTDKETTSGKCHSLGDIMNDFEVERNEVGWTRLQKRPPLRSKKRGWEAARGWRKR
jgi:hypothetical protein